MLSVTQDDVARMRSALLFDGSEGGAKLTRFWTLLLLAAVIASAGIVADSTATVIGAMIVAPLMTPILGIVLSIVDADLRNLAVSVALVVAGAVAVVAVAWMVGHVIPTPIVEDTSAQVAGRVHPRLIDLVAALATGAVGAFALVRRDVSDALPGVAIAISLVPPLAVAGLTLESGATDQAAGATLLFLTNVGAILLSGLVVMALYRVRRVASGDSPRGRLNDRAATVVVLGAVLVIAVPLAAASRQATSESLQVGDVSAVAQDWAHARDWEVVSVVSQNDDVLVRAVGPLPIPEPATFREALDAQGLHSVDVRVELVPGERADLPGR